jgi:hypothetical protein
MIAVLLGVLLAIVLGTVATALGLQMVLRFIDSPAPAPTRPDEFE